jgi:hypothetical protein
MKSRGFCLLKEGALFGRKKPRMASKNQALPLSEATMQNGLVGSALLRHV